MDRQQKRPIRWQHGRLSRNHRGVMPRPVAAAIVVTMVVGAVSAEAQEETPPPGAPAAFSPPALGTVGRPLAPGLAPDQTPATSDRPWTVSPSISLVETGTDNVRATPNNHQADLITTIVPALFATANSSRLQGTFDYAPSILRHLKATDEDSVAQNLLGNGKVTLYPDLLFFDASASANQVSRTGARGFGNTSQIPSAEQTQQISYAASPYARFHIADLAQSELRYRWSQAHFTGNTGTLVSPVTGQVLPAISDQTQQEAAASIQSLPDVSKLQVGLTADYSTSNSPDGSLDSRHTVGTVDFSYPITHTIHALASAGYERLTYSKQSQLDTIGPTWTVGGLYALNDQQTATLTYGRREGQYSFAGNARYAITPATSFSANYSTGVQTTQQQLLQGLLTASPTGSGTAIDTTTGLPISIVSGVLNPNVPVRNDITRAQNAEAGITTAIDRDSFSLVGTHVHEVSLLHLSPDVTSNGGFFTWSHQMSEALVSTMLLGYSKTSPTSVVTASAGLNYTFTDTIRAGVLYSLFVDSGGVSGTAVTNNLTFSITKTF